MLLDDKFKTIIFKPPINVYKLTSGAVKYWGPIINKLNAKGTTIIPCKDKNRASLWLIFEKSTPRMRVTSLKFNLIRLEIHNKILFIFKCDKKPTTTTKPEMILQEFRSGSEL